MDGHEQDVENTLFDTQTGIIPFWALHYWYLREKKSSLDTFLSFLS